MDTSNGRTVLRTKVPLLDDIHDDHGSSSHDTTRCAGREVHDSRDCRFTETARCAGREVPTEDHDLVPEVDQTTLFVGVSLS